MGLKLLYYGQNDSVNCTPDVLLTGDPGTDQQTLIAAGYLGGRIMALTGPGVNVTTAPVVIVPCDTDTSGGGSVGYEYVVGPGPYNPNDSFYGSQSNSGAHATVASGGSIPFATLLNGPGEFSGAIGPSGSKKAPVIRALWQGNVNQESYDTVNTTGGGVFVVGQYVYCGGTNKSTVGLYTTSAGLKGAVSTTVPVGICTHVPTTQEPWLGVASLL